MPNDFNNIAKQLEAASKQLEEQAPRLSILAANNFLAKLKRRVFRDGRNANEAPIGQYSTDPMLVGSTSFTNLGSQVASSKAVNTVFGSRKKRASRDWVTIGGKRLVVLKGGYKEFRQLVGRLVGKVDLLLTGDLFRSIVAGRTERGAGVGINNDENYLKALGNQERFKALIFVPSVKEEEQVEEVVGQELERIITGEIL